MELIDIHQQTADRLGISRRAAKEINFFEAYSGLRDICPTTDPVALANLIRCHRLAEIVSEPWNQEKSLEWVGLTQGQKFSPAIALATIEKFLPSDDRITASPVRDLITSELATVRNYLRNAAGRSDKTDFLQAIEQALRATAYIAGRYREPHIARLRRAQQKETIQ